MASWQKIIVSGSSAELNSVGLVTSMTVGANQTIATTQAGTKLSGSFSGSVNGELIGTASWANNSITASYALTTAGTVQNAETASYVIPTGLPANIVSSSAQIVAGIAGQSIAPTTVTATTISGSTISGSFVGDGSQLTGIATTLSIAGSTTGTDTVNLNTDTLTFSGASNVTATVTNNNVTIGVTGLVSQSAQIDVRNTTGIATIATTGSNTFTGIQTISNTTNSTATNNGALIVAGGIGVTKDVNISGSLNVQGVLTVATMSTQYVTSSQYNIGVSRITLNDDDLVRFAGLSVYDSGSTAGSGSLLWDSLNNRWIYQADDQNYNSAVIIAGPKNFGSLGDEVGLTAGRIPVATGDDHIDTSIASSSIRIDYPSLRTHIEAGLQVTGSITASVGFSGNGSGLTNVTAANVEYANVLNKPTLVSASGQIDHNQTTNYDANRHIDHTAVSITAGSGLSGGGTIAATRTLTLDTSSVHFLDGVKKELNTEGVLSSSVQVTAVLNSANVHSGSYLGTATTSNLPEGTNLYYLDTRVKDKLNLDGVVSSSAQIVAGITGQTIAPTTINATTINASGNVVVTGDLTVNGTTTTLNTTNVLIEDRYILLNSGSVAGAPAQGGIVVQDGANASGSALTYSTANSKNRWGVAESVAANATDATQTAYVATVTDMNVAAHSSAVATYEKPGNIKIETNGDIYIWA